MAITNAETNVVTGTIKEKALISLQSVKIPDVHVVGKDCPAGRSPTKKFKKVYAIVMRKDVIMLVHKIPTSKKDISNQRNNYSD